MKILTEEQRLIAKREADIFAPSGGEDAMLEAQARLTQEETKAEAINVYEPYIKLLEEEIGDLIGLAATHRWFSPRVEEGKKCRERIKAFKERQ